MTTESIEKLFRLADFSAGSSYQDELRDRLFRQTRKGAGIIPMPTLSDDALDGVAAGVGAISHGKGKTPDRKP